MSTSGSSPSHRRYVAVIGPGEADAETERRAEVIGRRLAEGGVVVVCGGLGGVMAAACRGAKSTGAGATTVGILPGLDRHVANHWVDVAIPTGLGEARNALIVRAVDVVVAVGGEFGTLSELALALKAGTPVVGLDTWQLAKAGEPVPAFLEATTPEDAARLALEIVRT